MTVCRATVICEVYALPHSILCFGVVDHDLAENRMKIPLKSVRSSQNSPFNCNRPVRWKKNCLQYRTIPAKIITDVKIKLIPKTIDPHQITNSTDLY